MLCLCSSALHFRNYQIALCFEYRGRAKIALGDWDDARVDLEAANEIQPHNQGIRNEIIKLDRKVKLFAEREKKRAAAMFELP